MPVEPKHDVWVPVFSCLRDGKAEASSLHPIYIYIYIQTFSQPLSPLYLFSRIQVIKPEGFTLIYMKLVCTQMSVRIFYYRLFFINVSTVEKLNRSQSFRVGPWNIHGWLITKWSGLIKSLFGQVETWCILFWRAAVPSTCH